MQYLFDVWSNVSREIRGFKYKLILFDYDGTLTEIVDQPEDAILVEQTRMKLKALAKKHGVVLGIVSGRSLTDIKERVDIEGIIYAGNHGLEIEGPGIRFIHPLAEEIQSFIRVIALVLKKTLGRVKGVIVEDKGLTLSIHYRMVEEGNIDTVDNILENAVDTARRLGKIKITKGKKVHEVRPAISWHKGKAVQMIIENYLHVPHRQNLIPVYLGDDLTDEDAFREIKRQDGISIYVGEDNPGSAAQYYLRSPDEVGKFISEITAIV